MLDFFWRIWDPLFEITGAIGVLYIPVVIGILVTAVVLLVVLIKLLLRIFKRK